MNIVEELAKLDELHRQGALNDVEFARAKTVLLRDAGSSSSTIAPSFTARPALSGGSERTGSARGGELSSLSASAQEKVNGELNEGETVRWAAQPSSARFALQGILPALFGIPFTGFAIFWMAKGFEMNAWSDQHFPGHSSGFDSLFPLFGIPFIVVGLGMLLSPLWLILKAQNTVYAITSRRAILFDGGWSSHTRSFGPADLGQIERREHGDGTGDLILAKESHYIPGHYSGTAGRGGHYVSGRWSTREIGFFGIPNPKKVQNLLMELASGGAS